MTKFKIKDSIWFVLGEGFRLYFKNIIKFTQYMLFPVFGQILGIALIFGLTGCFAFYLPALIEKYSFLNNFSTIIFIMIAITIPGFAIMFKALWDYLVAYGALNSMTEALVTTGKLYDLKAHTQVITQRSLKYISLLLIISILFLIGINPLFWIVGIILFVYFILIFQIFTLEEDSSLMGCFKRSFQLISGNFARTFVIMIILGFAIHLLKEAGLWLCDIIRFSDVLKGIFEGWAQTLPLNDVNNWLTYYHVNTSITALDIALGTLESFMLFIIAGLTLPVRSICWTLWYKNLAEVKANATKGNKKNKDK